MHTPRHQPDEADIRAFWDTHPCGDEMTGGVGGDLAAFFDQYDRLKYTLEPHIPACIDRLDVAGQRVLEVGLGEGAESEQLIRRDAIWSGLDLTPESVARVRERLALRGLEGVVREGSVLNIPWPDHSFDVVFSHGVLHHVPDIQRAQAEIRRVLRPGGHLVVMLYAKRSINYQVSIRVVRRIAVVTAYMAALAGWAPPAVLAGWAPPAVLAAHVRNARRHGLFSYLRMRRFLGPNTDGPDNPFSKVYGLRDVRRDFPDFEIVETHRHFMHAPPLPVHRLPGGSVLGWHLWVHLR